MARMLRSLLIGLFIEHVAGVLSDEQDPAVAFRNRARSLPRCWRSASSTETTRADGGGRRAAPVWARLPSPG